MTEDVKEGLKAFGEKRKPARPGKWLAGVRLQSGRLDAGDSADLVII